MPAHSGVERRRGIVAEWDDDRGFGFIRPMSGGSRVFVHVSAFQRGRRPVVGSQVSYDELRDERGRARADSVRYLTVAPSSGVRRDGLRLVLVVVGAFFAVLLGLVVADRMPITLLLAYGLLSAVTFLAYGADKTAAEQDEWRTSESTLHTFALVGGWPGALVAQRHFRHKTRKQPFRTIFWITVLANCAALAWFLQAAPVTLP